MKRVLALSAAFAAAALSSAHAQITISDSAYSASSYYTHSNGDSIYSFDFGANGNLYYATATPAYGFGGFYQSGGATPTPIVGATTMLSPGASVVAAGQYVYFNANDKDYNPVIYQYGPLSGAATSQVHFQHLNYSLTAHNGGLFISGAPGFDPNHIYYSGLNPTNGSLLSDPAIDLGVDSGASGPLAFDAAGDLFYAPGFGDLSIYRWTNAEVNAAIANSPGSPLSATGHKWLDYTSLYPQYNGPNGGGGASMLVDGAGNLVLTLTTFNGPSTLAEFGVGPDGAYNGSTDTILTAADRLGEVRSLGDSLLLADGNQIFQLAVPEPAVTMILALGVIAGSLGYFRHRRAAV